MGGSLVLDYEPARGHYTFHQLKGTVLRNAQEYNGEDLAEVLRGCWLTYRAM